MKNNYRPVSLEKGFLYQIIIQFVLYLSFAVFLGGYLKRSSYNVLELTGLNEISIYYYIAPLVLCIGFSCFFILKKLNDILPWTKYLILRFISGYLLTYLVTVLYLVIPVFIVIALNPNFTYDNLKSIIDSETLLKVLVLTGIALLIYNLVYFYIYSLGLYYKRTLETQRLKRKQLELHVGALKNQLTPHYLFNNLNTISSLLYTDKHATVDYIHRFAATCNFIINNSDKLIIPLKDELAFVGNYVYLMNIRFNDLISFNVSLSEGVEDFYVPPLSVQLLVENAIKHNSLEASDALNINLFSTDNNYLTVENNLTGVPVYINLGKNLVENKFKAESTGIGLENLNSRYYYLSGKKIIIKRDKNFSVKIPLLKNNI